MPKKYKIYRFPFYFFIALLFCMAVARYLAVPVECTTTTTRDNMNGDIISNKTCMGRLELFLGTNL